MKLSCAGLPSHLTGLLAGLWEFPAVRVEGEEARESMWGKIHGQLFGGGVLEADHAYLGLVRQFQLRRVLSLYTLNRLFISSPTSTITATAGMSKSKERMM